MSENDSNYDFYQLPNSLSSFKEKSKTESNYSKIKKTLFIILLGNFLTILYTINHNLLKKIKYSFNCPILFNCLYFLSFGFFWLIFHHRFSKINLYNILIIILHSQYIFFNNAATYDNNLNIDFTLMFYPICIIFTFIFNFIFFLKIKNSIVHLIGIFIVLFGIFYIYFFTNILKIYSLKEIKGHITTLIFIIISSICFSLSILFIQKYLKKSDILEFYPLYGILEGIILLFQSFFFQEPINFLKKKEIKFNLLGLIILFIINSTIFIGLFPYYIQSTSAGIFNINLCSFIFWDYLFFENISNYHYYIGYFIIFFGIIFFSFKNSGFNNSKKLNDVSSLLNNEND